jgi:ABC-2 type transport system ATP-binding protein
MVASIEILDLTKCYGELIAVDRLSLSIEQGEIFGFVGPNGAGKTSTIRMIAGLLQPTSGEITVAGHSVRRSPNEVKSLIGYMPDFFGVYPDLKVWEYLEFFSTCYQIPERQRPPLIAGLMELVDLQHRKEDMVDRLSRGMKQRLSLARTLIHDPQVLILDEPASGLDPRARVEIRESLVELSHMGKTIFFSTHILADVAEICTRVGIIEAGKLVAVGNLEDLQSQIMPHRRIEISLLDRLQEAQEILQNSPGVSNLEVIPVRQEAEPGKTKHRLTIEFSGEDLVLSQILAELVKNGIPVLHFSEDNRDLEEVFLRATKGIVT